MKRSWGVMWNEVSQKGEDQDYEWVQKGSQQKGWSENEKGLDEDGDENENEKGHLC